METIGHYKIVGCCIDAGYLAGEKMNRIRREQKADGYDAHRYHCRSCLKNWDVDHPASTGPEETTCSHCYGDKLTITKLRLWFDRAEGKP